MHVPQGSYNNDDVIPMLAICDVHHRCTSDNRKISILSLVSILSPSTSVYACSVKEWSTMKRAVGELVKCFFKYNKIYLQDLINPNRTKNAETHCINSLPGVKVRGNSQKLASYA